MKTTFLLIITAILSCVLSSPQAEAVAFTDSDVIFYGEIRQVGGAQTVLLQAGQLEMTFVNQSDPSNVVTLQATLEPTGSGAVKPFSYALSVPLAYLPGADLDGEFLSIGSEPTDFQIQGITVDGVAATLPDGSSEFYGLSFASRGEQYRLDLLVIGDGADTDGDGLPDWFEELYGLDMNIADATGDLDGDGWTNLEEFRLGSNPAVSNRDPQLMTAEVTIPEAGESGLHLQILDSDSTAAEIQVNVTGVAAGGFDLVLDGTPIPAGLEQSLSLADLQAGRLTISHTDRALSDLTLPVTWGDGGEPLTGAVVVRAVTPSTTDGNDAKIWLDGNDLPAAGASVDLWTDRSGNAHNASQPLASHQPVVSGQAVDFGRSGSAHLFFQDVGIPVGDHTILASYQAAPSSDVAQTIFSTNRGFLMLAPTSEAISYPGAPVYQMDGVAVGGFENTAGATMTSIFRREGALLQNIFGLSYDGESTPTALIDPVLPTLGGVRSAFATGPDPLEQSFDGQLNELLVFPTALPEQKLRSVHDYLQSKWGDTVIWDFSTDLRAVTLNLTSSFPGIIRGGHGDDVLGGGPMNDTISGGPGSDLLSGGAGVDRFVFGGVDTGNDVIIDFETDVDIIDLSAHFWGQVGDARDHVTVRLDANFTTPVPTIDSVLVVTLPGGGVQELVLQNRVVGTTEFIRMVVEGQLQMGGLTIPAELQMALAAGSLPNPLQEATGESFSVNLTRSGDGVAAALEVPIGFFADALGGDAVLEQAISTEGRRAVVAFDRGETHKVLTFRTVPDLQTEGTETWQVEVLPHYKYALVGTAVTQTVTDVPMVWMEILQANAVTDPSSSPAMVRIHRDGDLSESLVVDLALGGSAVEGVHIQDVPETLTIGAGQESGVVPVIAISSGLSEGPEMVVFQLGSSDRYQLGNPSEGLLSAALTEAEANSVGFNNWLETSTSGAFSSLADLSETDQSLVSQYLQAYALGLSSVEELGTHQMAFSIVDGRPEISTRGALSALDVQWGVESFVGTGDWEDVSGTFVSVTDPEGLRLVGVPLAAGEEKRFYRLNLGLNPGLPAGSNVMAIGDATRFGISGEADWTTAPTSGDLISSGGAAGAISRIVSEVSGTADIDFEMRLTDANGSDSLKFFIDGIEQASTTGAMVRVLQTLSGEGPHLLMWEFQRGSGSVVIRNLDR